jgi:hypothetical protein
MMLKNRPSEEKDSHDDGCNQSMTTTTMTVTIISTCMSSSSPTVAAMKIHWSSDKCKMLLKN